MPITKRTLELGSRHSPDFVCVPFKYNMGNYIESLERGADVLLQSGGGCRYGYYGEIQKQILTDLGYAFDFICLSRDHAKLTAVYRTCQQLGSCLSFVQFGYAFYLTAKIIRMMDIFEFFMRENIGFETQPGSFQQLHSAMLEEIAAIESASDIHRMQERYLQKLHNLPTEKPEHLLRVGMVGELYTLMEPFSNFFLEKELSHRGVVLNRYMNVSYLLFDKSKIEKKILQDAGMYLKYFIGADGTGTVAKGRTLAEQQYDGLIHVKPFGCTPEINAMPMLQNIGQDYKIPVLYFSFDSQTTETGVKTRLEAFTDMLMMRRQGQEKNCCSNRVSSSVKG